MVTYSSGLWLCLGLVTALTVFSTAVLAADTVVIHDETFTNSNWSLVNGGGQNVSSITAFQENGNGVTGNTRVTRVTGFSPMRYDTCHYKTDLFWSPTTDGAFDRVDWQIWYRVSGVPTYGILQIMARQGGIEFVAPGTYREPQNFQSNWQKASGTFFATDFTPLQGASSSLSFALGAPKIEFGYRAFANINLATNQVNYRSSFYDLQLQKVAVVVSEASAFALLGIGGMAAVGTFSCQKRGSYPVSE